MCVPEVSVSFPTEPAGDGREDHASTKKPQVASALSRSLDQKHGLFACVMTAGNYKVIRNLSLLLENVAVVRASGRLGAFNFSGAQRLKREMIVTRQLSPTYII